MCGLEWRRLYETYHNKPYNRDKVWERVEVLYEDPCVNDHRGIFEYVLGGEEDKRLINIRVFSELTKRKVYSEQTKVAERKNISNCPLCAVGHEANKTKIWSYKDMDVDYVSAWSNGGAIDVKNCQMLCKTHNRSKGNR